MSGWLLAAFPLFVDFVTFLANGEEGGGAAPADKKETESNPMMWLMPLIAIGFLWYFIIIMPQRRQQSQRDQMIKSLKKNDKVVTIGGIIGTVASISTDGKEVTLKIDDSTRVKMVHSSIQTVIRDEDEKDGKASKEKDKSESKESAEDDAVNA